MLGTVQLPDGEYQKHQQTDDEGTKHPTRLPWVLVSSSLQAHKEQGNTNNAKECSDPVNPLRDLHSREPIDIMTRRRLVSHQ